MIAYMLDLKCSTIMQVDNFFFSRNQYDVIIELSCENDICYTFSLYIDRFIVELGILYGWVKSLHVLRARQGFHQAGFEQLYSLDH